MAQPPLLAESFSSATAIHKCYPPLYVLQESHQAPGSCLDNHPQKAGNRERTCFNALFNLSFFLGSTIKSSKGPEKLSRAQTAAPHLGKPSACSVRSNTQKELAHEGEQAVGGRAHECGNRRQEEQGQTWLHSAFRQPVLQGISF